MERFIVAVYIILGLASAASFLYLKSPVSPLPASTLSQPAASATASIGSKEFNVTGTLVYYPNNVGPVPYVFYQDSGGNTVTKALIFPTVSPIDSSWSGAHVSVTGTVENEHVMVRHIRLGTANGTFLRYANCLKIFCRKTLFLRASRLTTSSPLLDAK